MAHRLAAVLAFLGALRFGRADGLVDLLVAAFNNSSSTYNSGSGTPAQNAEFLYGAVTGTTGTGAAAVGPVLWDADGATNFIKQAANGRGEAKTLAGGFTPAAPTCTFTRGANTTAYTIGDEVGTASTTPTTVAVGRFNGASGVILGAQVVYSSYAAVIPQLVVALFSASVTLAGDNAQLNLSDSDAALCIGLIPLTAAQSGQYSAGAPVAHPPHPRPHADRIHLRRLPADDLCGALHAECFYAYRKQRNIGAHVASRG